MGRLIYAMTTTLDGFVDDAGEATEPDRELHEHFNRMQERLVLDVYGRRMWETMRYWQDPPAEDLEVPYVREYTQAWQDTDRVVVSRTLTALDAPRTTLWPELDVDRLRALVAEADGDVSVGGPALAGAALRAGLVDEVSAYVGPRVAGAGSRRFVPEGLPLELRLRETERFASGVVALVYDVVGGGTR
ncbi:dihydrofolate reductase family protein [Janibacter melonis]|uniref:dihydrofolate reductase family protein n=1 Tax=Janibacter melonis TaxID=262209 RepID=UPI002043734C|nr:dihydrofolate reductase family protein [Janibacter melonis]MCM3556503.1 dihydrofolate reductase family protein [Janibacter melonis]